MLQECCMETHGRVSQAHRCPRLTDVRGPYMPLPHALCTFTLRLSPLGGHLLVQHHDAICGVSLALHGPCEQPLHARL